MALTWDKIKNIQELRKKGFSIPEIAKQEQISKSTVLRRVQGIEILPEHKQRWLGRKNASKIISERSWNSAIEKGRELLPEVFDEHLALIAASLYWAEGAKNDFSFTNSDPNMVKVFVSILRKTFLVKDEDFKISLRLYEDLDKSDCIKFWSAIVGVNLANNVSIHTLNGSKKGKLKYGMCRVRVKKGGLLLKTIFAINKRVIAFVTPRSSTDRAAPS
jgi:hypothetical protein